MKKLLTVLLMFMFTLLLGCKDNPDKELIISASKTIIELGEELNFISTLSNNEDVDINWDYDQTIISINNNIGTSLKEGETIVKAIKDDMVSNELKIIVNEKTIKIEKIEIDGPDTIFETESATYIAKVTYVDDVISTNVTWTVEPEDLAIIDLSGNLIAKKEGLVTITAKKSGKIESRDIKINKKSEIKEINENSTSSLGVNLGFLNYYDASFTFLNIFNETMNWVPQHKDDWVWDTGEELNLDENGWISSFNNNQTATTLIRRALEEYPIGEYVLTYEGEGKINIGLDGKKVYEELGIVNFVVEKASSQGIAIAIEITNPKNYIRNIKVYEKRYEDLINAGETFYPEFLDKIKKFNTLRYMEFGGTNGNEATKWEDRTKKSNYTQGMRNGASYEYMIELSNRVNANPWICIPHKADDDYVRNMAILIRDSLKANLTLYIEYTNEPWNWAYGFQAGYLRDQFTNEGLELQSGVWAPNTAYYSYRASQCMKIFEEVFGGTDRIVRVLGAQAAWDSPAREALKYQDNYKNFDAIAIAPYYNADIAFSDEEYMKENPNTTVDDVIDLCRESVSKSIGWVEQNKIVADEYGMDLIAYEGGSHLAIFTNPTNKETLDKIFIEASFHPDMEEIYKHYLEEWKRVGGNLFVHYKAIDSRWGLYDSVFDDDNAPKAKAAIQFMEENPKWW